MAKLTKQQIKEYVASGGVRCPVCKSEDITGGVWNATTDEATQEVSCNDCESYWLDVYKLVGVELQEGQ